MPDFPQFTASHKDAIPDVLYVWYYNCEYGPNSWEVRQALTVDEIIADSPPLARFRDVLDWVIAEARRRKFDVATRFDVPVSSCETYGGAEVDGFVGRIRVNPRDVVGLEALWDLVHEFGHSLQELPPAELVVDRNDAWLEREDDAWQRGWDRVVQRFPRLGAHHSDYEVRRLACMKSNRATIHGRP